MRGVEPLTSALRTQRSAKLSYIPKISFKFGVLISESGKMQISDINEFTCDFQLETSNSKLFINYQLKFS